MRCGYKSVFIVILIVVDAAALAGTILNLVWMEADVEQRRWLGWALLIADGLAVLLSVLVGVFHWTRLRHKMFGGRSKRSQMKTFHQIDLEKDPVFEDHDNGTATGTKKDTDPWAGSDDFE